MIKNQLYPYIEKYINEYLFGFTKEQLNIGVMNGRIQLDNLIIRPDSTNEKLNELDLPIWIKAGIIKKIYVGCSLMNFLGEKPLEIEIGDVDMIISPSFKWINKNINTFIMELEHHMREMYDPTDNNCSNIFQRKINFIDSSVYSKLKKPFIKLFQDNTFFSRMVSAIYTKVVKFFYKKSYLIKLTVRNINLRFEDDTFNYYGSVVFGLKINMFELNLSVDGVNKKDSFKVEGIDIFSEINNPKLLLPSKLLKDNLDVNNKIKDEKFYDFIRKLNLKTNMNSNSLLIVDNFNFCGNFGISIVDSKNIDFFSKAVEKNYNFYLQVATSELKINLFPQLILIIQNFIDFAKSYFIIEQIQDFKPMRRPYENSNKIVQNLKDVPKFKTKRLMVVRDWFYYMIWFSRVKKALYGNYFKNIIHEEFSKYFCVAFVNPNTEQCAQGQISDNKIEEINPENVHFNLSIEILIKGLNINLKQLTENQSKFQDEGVNLKIQGIENKIYLKNKQIADFFLNFKSLFLSSSKEVFIDKAFEDSFSKASKQKSKQANNECQILSTLHNDKPRNFNKSINFNVNQDNDLDDSNEISSEERRKEEIPVNNQLLILSDILSNIDSNNSSIPRKPVDNKSEISIFTSQTNTSCRSFLKVFLKNEHIIDDKKIQMNKKMKNQEFSNKIFEFNKDLMKSNPVKIDNKIEVKRGTSTNGLSSTNVSINEKVKLNIFELTTSSGEDMSMKLLIKKDVVQGKLTEKLSLQLGNIRINIVPSMVNSFLSAIIPFTNLLNKLLNLSGLKEKLNIRDNHQIHEMRKYAINNLKDIHSIETQLYVDYLKENLLPFESLSINNFGLDYTFHMLMNNNYEISINYQDFFILGVDHSPKQNNLQNNKEIVICSNNSTDYCKIRFPDLDLNIKFSESVIQAKLFDIEFKYSNLDKWKHFLTTITSIVMAQISPQTALILPLFKKILNENKLHEFNESNEINKIINSNIRSIKAENNRGEGSDTEELKSMSDY
jgi:hypothetical protein